jgi:hypothetical protein
MRRRVFRSGIVLGCLLLAAVSASAQTVGEGLRLFQTTR